MCPIRILALSLAILAAGPAWAEAPSFLPKLSPQATVSQMVGTAQVTIEYDRPAVRNRRIWGELVPYGQIWRSGANAATTIRFSQPVRINGQQLAAGTYALFTIPGPDQWDVVFNRRANQWGAFEYNAKDDALRIRVKARTAPFNEWLTFEVTPTSTSSAYVDLLWEKLRISFLVDVDVAGTVNRRIQEVLAKAKPTDWKVWCDVANYLVEQDRDMHLALSYVDRSIRIKENATNLYVKAQVLRNMGDAGALSMLEKAERVGAAQHAGAAVLGPIQTTLLRWRQEPRNGAGGQGATRSRNR